MKGQRKLTASAMALFLAASFLSFSWSAPQSHFQRRNWTPQAMLYLKGALFENCFGDCKEGITTDLGDCFHPFPTTSVEGRRFISDESQRKDLYNRMQLETRSQNKNPLSLSEAAALFLSSLQKAQGQVEEENSDHPGYLTENISN